MEYIEKQIEQARKNLLDLSMRNRLINFRPTKRRTLRIIDEIPREIYEILVINERSMEFLPTDVTKTTKPSPSNSPFEPPNLEDSNNSGEVDSSIWELPPPDESVATRHVDRYLQTNLEPETLQRRLFYIYQESNSVFEEQGYTVLYLALGFLEWSESSNSTQYRRAPLILIPAELERQSVRSRFKVKWTGEEISTNISLQEKLKEQSILIPDFEMPDTKEGITDYFQSVQNAISSMPNWKIYDDIYLGFFSFTKFVMWKDLDINSWPENVSLNQYALINALFNPAQNFVSGHSEFDESEIDNQLTASCLYHVMDADPSQIKVIENVKQGRNLVVEGPPGTGKSQTITNIIAELLIKGKSVLFISEKMAALEVVKGRLDSIGLGEFCLELHSRKSKKKEVLREIERTISSSSNIPQVNEHEYHHLDRLKSELNDYAKALRQEVGNTALSVYKLFNMYEGARQHYKATQHSMPIIEFPRPDAINENQWKETIRFLGELKDLLPLVKPIASNPWKHCSPNNITKSEELNIRETIDECISNLTALNSSLNSLSEQCATFIPNTFKDIDRTLTASRIIAISKPIDRNVLLNTEWNEPSGKASETIECLKSFHINREIIQQIFTDEALNLDIQSILNEYEVHSKKILRFLPFSRFRSLKREIANLYIENLPNDKESIISDLKHSIDLIKQRNQLRSLNETGESLFGSHWRGENSDPNLLLEFSEWILCYRKEILAETITERSADIVSSGVTREEIESLIHQAEEYLQNSKKYIDTVKNQIHPHFESIFGKEVNNVPISSITNQLKLWSSGLEKLHLWSQYVVRRNNLENTCAAPLLKYIENDGISSEDLEQCFIGNFANNLLEFSFKDRPSLANFIGELHERKIKDFSDLDRELINKNQTRVQNELFKKRPPIYSDVSKGSEAGVLLGEINRKRGHMPIRKLLINCGSLIRKYKPCFMMSPLSVAQFLDPSTINFDVIIFDEASQVKPEDALGSLLRGGQLVVMGDTKQLPPTSFFDLIVEVDDEDEEEAAQLTDMESILHKCKTCFPTNTLKWHYRSKHESLIAVSNQEFYDNQLLIYPSPINDPNFLGLKHEYNPNSVYDRGRSSVNRIEAKQVAEACIEHYRKFPKKSLGVGTFNIKQQQAILEEIEFQLREHPDMEVYFKSDREEHFFVKNLETIQGDERDVIFLSIGFGKDENGRPSRNFGPLNQEGGYRRLNVLITRARERCVVFSNFKAEDLKVDENSVFGLRALKTFLEFANNRRLISMKLTGADSDSPFEDSVREFLRSHGHEVHKQIGCAGFRVDLGIVDPSKPGNYLLGIECDGAKYHSSPVARDRDRLRQQILESKGWKIYRIWSTDWYRNRKESENRLLDAIQNSKENSEHINPSSLMESEEKEENNGGLVLQDFTPRLEYNSAKNENSLYDEVADYTICESLGIPMNGELHEQPAEILSQGIIQVVEIEGPIHFDEAVRRIRLLWGLGRAGRRIHEAIEKAARYAESNGNIKQYGKFLWALPIKKPVVRKRSNDPQPNIEIICDEEITEAIKIVLKHQHATLKDDLVIQASRLLGFQATRTDTYSKIESIVNNLIGSGELVHRHSGMLDLTN